MTERLYYEQSDLLEFEARITEVGQDNDRPFVILDRTAFYPTSGGQSHDTGLLNGVAVVDVTVERGQIRHFLSEPAGEVGKSVRGEIDALRRRHNSQQHTAQHILSQALARLYDFETVSVHLGESYGAVELDTAQLSEKQAGAAEAMANEIIAANLVVDVTQYDREAVASLPLRKPPPDSDLVRVVTIPGFDWSACGGTHTTTTGGVGLIKLIGQETLRGHALVKFLCGDLARADYQSRFATTSELAKSLTCHYRDLPEIVTRLDDDAQTMRRQVSILYEELLPIRVEAVASQAGGAIFSPQVVASLASLPDQRLAARLAPMLAERTGLVALILTDGRLYIARPENDTTDAGLLARRLALKTGLKGGGNTALAQLGGAEAAHLEQYHRLVTEMLDG